MKKFLIGVGILSVGIAAYFLFFPGSPVSPAQQETRGLLGDPDQFVITYLPQGGDETRMVRSEVWYYAGAGKQVSFLGGDVVSVDPYKPEAGIGKTALLPEAFDAAMDISDVNALLETPAARVNDLPVFDGPDIATYISAQGLFVIENGYLTYMQTLDTVTSAPSVSGTPMQTAEARTTDARTVKNAVYGFSIRLPDGWRLASDDIVLSSYDTGYLESGGTLPEERVKCDFVPSEPGNSVLSEEGTVSAVSGISIRRTRITEDASEGPGYGDGVLYAITASGREPLWLVCFSLSESLRSDLERALGTFSYGT